MTFEGPNNLELPENFTSAEVTEVRNAIQRALVLDLIGSSNNQEERNDIGLRWIYKYAHNDVYPTVFNNYLAEHPNIITDWDNIAEREKVILDIRERLEKIDPWDSEDTDQSPRQAA